jgi:formylglycine-generating enzyme required for sulfatase activity
MAQYKPGDQLNDNYRIEEFLGAGTFGTVYKAKDSLLDRTVALKVLHPQYMVEPGFVERFCNEARRVAALEHPNILTIYNMGEADGYAFIAMRYMPGKSLRERLAAGPLPYAQALAVITQVCAGLGAAHARGLVHRDIKPENILFGEGQQVVITDFKLDTAVQVSSSSSSMGGVGTPHYRAPELWRGKPPATPATDVYSTACLFVEMLTGERLFGGDTPDEIITRHLIDGPVLPSNWPAGAPAGLSVVLAKALRKNPAERYQAVQFFSNALGQLAYQPKPAKTLPVVVAPVHEPAAAQTPPVHRVGQPPSWLGYLPVLAVVGLALLCFVVAGIIVLRGLLTSGDASVATEAPVPVTTEPVRATDISVPSAMPTFALLLPAAPPAPTAVPTEAIEEEPRPDGMLMLKVPAGEFSMGNELRDDEKPVHTVMLADYWIDQTEVTNDMFSLFVQAASYKTRAEEIGKSWMFNPTAQKFEETTGADWRHPQGPATDLAGLGQHPVVHVSWKDAAAYCAWAGSRLPTEAEWEKAARGMDGRKYPWGEAAVAGELLNFADINLPVDWADKNINDGFQFTAPVGSYPRGASPFGALDMVGNVWEWTADWYQAYPGNTIANELYGERYRVLRGGSWYNVVDFVHTGYRFKDIPANTGSYFGFRCARGTP